MELRVGTDRRGEFASRTNHAERTNGQAEKVTIDASFKMTG